MFSIGHFSQRDGPKDWDYKVVLKDVGSESVLIDATAWRFAMLRYSDGLGIFRHRHSPSPLGPHAGHGSESSGWIVGNPDITKIWGYFRIGGDSPSTRFHRKNPSDHAPPSKQPNATAIAIRTFRRRIP